MMLMVPSVVSPKAILAPVVELKKLALRQLHLNLCITVTAML